MLQSANITSFPGFSLLIFDIPKTLVSNIFLLFLNNDMILLTQALSGRLAKQIALQVRAINYAANLVRLHYGHYV